MENPHFRLRFCTGKLYFLEFIFMFVGLGSNTTRFCLWIATQVILILVVRRLFLLIILLVPRRQVATYACIYTSKASNLARVSIASATPFTRSPSDGI